MTQGFSQGDDFVAARVSIDVPTEGIQTLKEMSQGIDRFRTAVESAARSSQTFVGYIQQMTQAQNMASEAGRNLAQQLERNAELQQRAMTGTGTAAAQLPLSRSAPQGYVDNFAGMGAGMGSGRAPTTDIQMQQSQVQAGDPYKYVNAQAGRSRVQPSDIATTPTGAPDMRTTADRVEARDKQQRETQDSLPGGDDSSGRGRGFAEGVGEGFGGNFGGGLARNIMNEMHVGGGSAMSMMGLGHKLLSGLGGRASAAAGSANSGTATAQAASEMGAEGALGALGRVGGPVGIGLAGLGLLEKGGGMYQGYKNLGSIRGGGAAEGMETEMGIRSLALNPFISNEQSRQIIMAGLTEGYSGKQFDTVTQFMAPQPVDSPILTPTGWVKMGDLQVGDEVIGAVDGRPRRVLGVKDWGHLEVQELTFQDGTTVQCATDHKWMVYSTTRSRGPSIKSLREMMRQPVMFNSGSSLQPRYRVPLTAPVEFHSPEPLPVDPYLLGLLLGDGDFGCSIGEGKIRLSCCIEGDSYTFSLPDGVTSKRVVSKRQGRYASTYEFGVGKGIQQDHHRGRPVNPLKIILRDLGLLGVTGADKFIPERYLISSAAERIALLQGLVDTDGCIGENGAATFSNTSRMLVEGVAELVRSLGGIARISWREPRPNHPWGSRLPLGTVSIRFPPGIVPARLPRKAQRYRPSLTTSRRASKGIVDISPVGMKECVCISISDSDGWDSLYVTENYCVTSNSNLKDMNIQVSDSVQMIRKNVNEGGQSIQGLASSLAMLKEASKTGNLSLPDRQRMFEQGTSNLISAGMSGVAAGQTMTEGLNVWDEDPAMKGKFGDFAQSVGSSPTGMAMAESLSGITVPGLDPEAASAYMSDHGQDMGDFLGKAAQGAYKKAFGNTKYPDKKWYNQVKVFRSILNIMGYQVDYNTAMMWAKKMAGGGNPADEGRKKQQQITSQVNGGAGLGTFFSGAAGAIGSTILDAGKMFVGGVSGLWNGNEGDQAAINAADDMGKAWTNAAYDNNAEASNPMLNKIVGQYGAGDVEVGGGGNGWSTLDGSKAQVSGLASGQLKWRRKGEQGDGLTLAQTPQDGSSRGGGGGGGKTDVNFSPAQVQISFGANGQPTASPNPVRLTPNQQQVNSGAGDATMNNPPPGDGFGYYPGRGQWLGNSQ